jgi:hypothetical protein
VGLTGRLSWRPAAIAARTGPATAAPTGPAAGAARPPATGPLARAWLVWLPALLVGFGVVVRVRQYLFRRSLWGDEAAISLNLVGRGYRELLGPLDANQSAPVGWLWAQRATVELLGPSEHALRLLPLLAGVGTLVLLWWLARRLLPAWLVPLAVALAACSPWLRHYSTETKQYASDAAVGLLLLAASLPLLRERPGWRALLAWAGIGAVAVWCSHPAVLLLAGYGAAVAGRQLLRRDWAAAARVAAAGTVWGLSFLAVYAVSLRPATRNHALQRYWRDGLAPRPLDPAAAAGWLGGRWAAFVDNPLGLAPRPLVAVLLLAGGAALLARRRDRAALLLAPLPVFVAAGLVRAYPLQWRLLLVLVPTALLLAAAAPDWPGRPLGLVARGLGVALVGLALLAPGAAAVRSLGRPETVAELRPLLETVAARRQPGDRLWVHGPSGGTVRWYGPGLGLRSDASVDLVHRARCDDGRAIGRAAGGGRVWLVLGYRLSSAPDDEWARILARLDRVGSRTDAAATPGAAAYRYDLAGPPPGPDPGPAPGPGPWCLRVGPPDR